jgi:indolepyruvate ferredoxin oxidoreductase
VKDPFADLPMPQAKDIHEPYSILITGIGGTGVITIGALLGMAAHLEGKGCTVLDFTGLSQKNGAVMSHVRLAARPEDLAAVRMGPAGADLLLGCDMIVSASPAALSRIEQGATRVVINEDLPPTAGFVGNTDIDFEGALMKRSLRQAAGERSIDFVDATETATALMGDSIATNSFMLGYAFQKGYVPLSLEAIERAIELNGAGVEMNKRALAWGRLAAHNPSEVSRLYHP